MMMTEERGKELMEYFEADPARTQELLDLPVEEAVAKMNADGHDFTQEELEVFDAALDYVPEKDELKADDLDAVAGGWGGFGNFFNLITPQYALTIANWGRPFGWRTGGWGGRRFTPRRRP